MAQANNISITRLDTGAAETVTLITPSGGGEPAIWQFMSDSQIRAHRPTVLVQARANAAKTGRVVDFQLVTPILAEVNGVLRPVGKYVTRCQGTRPDNMQDSAAAGHAGRLAGLLASGAILDLFANGYVPS